MKRRHLVNMSESPVFVGVGERKGSRKVLHGKKVIIDEEWYQLHLAENDIIAKGLLVEIHPKTGEKIVKDNPNILLDKEIDDLLDKDLETIEKFVIEITSEPTLRRVYGRALEKDLPISLCDREEGLFIKLLKKVSGLPEELRGSGAEQNIFVNIPQYDRRNK